MAGLNKIMKRETKDVKDLSFLAFHLSRFTSHVYITIFARWSLLITG